MAEIGSLLSMLLAVILILILAWWVTSLVARQGVGGLSGLPGLSKGMDELCVLRQIPVSRNERLVLVRLHNRFLLLGAAQGGVTLLAELTEEESLPWLEQAAEGKGADFRKLMHMSTKK